MDEKRSGSLSNNFFPEEIWQTKRLDGGSLFVTYGHMDYGREFETLTGPTLGSEEKSAAFVISSANG